MDSGIESLAHDPRFLQPLRFDEPKSALFLPVPDYPYFVIPTRRNIQYRRYHALRASPTSSTRNTKALGLKSIVFTSDQQ